MRVFLHRFAAFVGRARIDERLDEEVRAHLDSLAADYQRRGMTADEARHAARRAFGGVESMKEQYRDRRGVPLLSDVASDVKFGVRLLLKDRWVTATAGLVLALGIAAANTVFTLANTMLFRDLPFTAPDRIVAIGTSVGGSPRANAGVSHLDLLDYRTGARSFDGLAAVSERTMNIADDEGVPERVVGAYLSANAFDLIGETPMKGRGFSATDDRPGATPVLLLGESLWRARYRAAQDIVGRTIRVNGVPSVVIGVMREGLGFPVRSRVWQPLAQLPSSLLDDRRARGFDGVGRLAAGITLEQGAAELASVAAGLAQRYPDTNTGAEPRVIPYRLRAIGGRARTTMPLLLGLVLFVLLIACANVANLLLARASSRAREITVRLAVGASRVRVVRQLLVESAVLASVGGLAGFALSLAGIRLFWRALSSGSMVPPYWLILSPDWRVFVFAAVVCLGTAMVFGVVPALHASRTSVAAVLNSVAAGSGGAARRSRWANRFVIAQLAFTPVLLTAAGLLLRSVVAQNEIDPGVRTAGIVRIRLDLTGPRYAETPDRARFYTRFQEALGGMPSVRAALASQAPFEGADTRRLVSGDSVGPGESPGPIVRLMTIGAGYFETLAAQPVRGREFTLADGASGVSPALVNERFVAMHLPDGDPIGRPVTLAQPPATGRPDETFVVVGVAPDIRQRSTEDAAAADPIVYVPYAANPVPVASVLVRTDASPGAVASVVREQLRGIDPDLALFDVMTLDRSLAGSDERLGLRVFSTMVAAFAAIGLLLATIGVYAVTAYAAAQRTREIGLRIALGAVPSHVWWFVTRRAVRQLVIGLAIGLAGSLAIGQLLRAVLIGTASADPLTLLAVVALLALATLAASLIPARAAMRTSPVGALRVD